MRLRIWCARTSACALLMAAGVCANAQDAFEAKYESGIKANPVGVGVMLRATSGRTSFHLYETIPITLEFTNTGVSRYSIEMGEEMNAAGQSNRFYVSDAENASFTSQQVFNGAVVCCDSEKRFLSRRPVKLNRELTDYIRFKKPGTYKVFYVTNRVFRGVGKPEDFEPSKLPLTSNQLTLTILPDEDEWNSRQLSATLSILRDPDLKRKYVIATRRAKASPSGIKSDYGYTNIVFQTEYVLAQKALIALNTEEAIEQRVAMMNMESEADLDLTRKYGSGSILPQPLFASTTRPDLLIAAMEKRASDPDFGIDYGYAELWTHLLVQREHPETFRPFFETGERGSKIHDYLTHYREAEESVLGYLEKLDLTKRGEGKEITELTIKTRKKNRSDK